MHISYIINPKLPVIKNDWPGNILIGNRFSNSTKKEGYSIWEVLRWKLSPNPQRKEKKNDPFKLEVLSNANFSSANHDMIVWLGHSSFFIKLGGVSFLTDPFFFNTFFKKRYAAMPCKVSDIKNIDYVLISHNHRDHLNYKSLKAIIKNNPNAQGLLPLRSEKKLHKQFSSFQEAAWYQPYNLPGNVKIFFMPSKHWSRRGLFDHNKSLWGSFVLQYNDTTIFFDGDTAYGEHFTEIAAMFPKIDYALVPIGAYKPRFIMARAHVDPNEAVSAVNILKPKIFIPMHFGTLDLANEPMGEPYRMVTAMNNAGEINSQLKFLKIGEELRF